MKRAIFLDRDGTLNPDPGYISDPDQFELFPGTAEALQKMSRAGFLLVLITNQSGIARGLITRAQLQSIHDKLENILARHAVRLSGIYFCPHHPDFPDEHGVSACDCRKPEPGLILQAIKDLDIDPEESFMIGDKKSDIELACNAGVTPVFIGSDSPKGFERVVCFSDLGEAADWILAGEHGR